MQIALQIIFWLSILVIAHSYIIYPLLLTLLPKKNENKTCYTNNDQLPVVSILMSIFNEEEVIAEKIDSILASNYPLDKIEIIIGSDNSSDKSNEIVSKLAEKHNLIKFYPFYERQGKPGVINQIFAKATGEIIVLSDANVFFHKDTVFEMVKHFKNEQVGLVDTHMINKGLVKDGISIQESAYISREVKIKNAESNIWGTMMGPFGGCYSIRRELYKPVPANFLVDDFYINMKVLQKGRKAINNLQALVFEDVSNNLKDEFRRKIRIATGNFQNLNQFKKLLLGILGLNPFEKNAEPVISKFGVSFSFLSHKVLRWIIPFFIVAIFISNIFLLDSLIYQLSFAGLIFSFTIPFWDILLKKANINISLLRFITHFYSMNLALFIGFFRSIKGVKSGVWQPTKRNQTDK